MAALYQYSWLILFAPLFSFAVIVFGTRVWDLLSRPRPRAGARPAPTMHEGHGDVMSTPAEDTAATHAEAHAVEEKGAHGEDHGEHGLDDDEDPKVPQLTMGARA